MTRPSERLSLFETDGSAFCRFAVWEALYQFAPCAARDVFLLQFVLALADAVHGIGSLRAVAESVGVAVANFDNGFAVAQTLLALQEQVHIAAGNFASVATVSFF